MAELDGDRDEERARRYVQTQGAACPWCHSVALERKTFEDDFDDLVAHADRDVSCTHCGAKWTEVYDMASVMGFEPGRAEEEGRYA